jgi:carbamoyltransferase
MIILGINGGFTKRVHDPACALLIDGCLRGFLEEERLNRQRHSPGRLPLKAISHLLKEMGLTMRDVDVIAFPQITWGQNFINLLHDKLNQEYEYCPPIWTVDHHAAHAACAWFWSPFERCGVISVDGSGDGICTAIFLANPSGCLERIYYKNSDHSLGLLYSGVTQLLGFRPMWDEYKLMALAGFGDKNLQFGREIVIVDSSGDYHIKPGVFSCHLVNRAANDFPIQSNWLNSSVAEEIIRVGEGSKKNIALWMQQTLEQVVSTLIERHLITQGIRQVCFTGGVAQNCVMIGQIAEQFSKFGIECSSPPTPHDGGTAIGSAILCSINSGEKVCRKLTPFLSEIPLSKSEIQLALSELNLPFSTTVPSNLVKSIVADIQEHGIVALCHGPMEAGPRALGNRSILADPRDPKMQDRINRMKRRESFRPFGASLLSEDLTSVVGSHAPLSPYMNIAMATTASFREKCPSVVHSNGITRYHTVDGQGTLLENVCCTCVCSHDRRRQPTHANSRNCRESIWTACNASFVA